MEKFQCLNYHFPAHTGKRIHYIMIILDSDKYVIEYKIIHHFKTSITIIKLKSIKIEQLHNSIFNKLKLLK